MSDDSLKINGFGSLAKQLQDKKIDVSEDELASLYSDILENSKDGTISASVFAKEIKQTYGLKGKDKKEILETLSEIASNDGVDKDLSIDDFNFEAEEYAEEIKLDEQANQYANSLSSDDKEKIIESLSSQADNLMNQLDETVSDQGWLSRGLSKINNLFGFGTSENEAKAKIEEYQKLISELNPDDPDFASKYKAITGEDLSEESASSLLFDSDEYIESYKEQYEAQYGTSMTDEQVASLKDYIENESNVNKLSGATEAIYDYENTQSSAKEIAVGVAVGLVTAAAVIAAPVTGGTSLLLGAAVGGATKVALEGTDTIGTSHKYTLEEGILDFASGAVDGTITAMTLGGANLAGKGFKAVFSTASKTMVKNQTIANAKNLVTSGGETMLKQAFTGFAKSTARAVGIAEISTVGRYAIDTVGKTALYDATGNYTVSETPSQVVQNDDGTYLIYYAVTDSNNGDNLYYQIETVDSYSEDEDGNYVKGNVLSTSQSNDFNAADLGKQMATSAVAAGTGAVIGRFTNNLINPTFTALSNSTVIGNIAEMTADGALSLGADYLMASAQQGEFVSTDDFFTWDRILGEGRNQIRGLLIGVASSKTSASTSVIEQEAGRLIQSGDETGARQFLQENGYRDKNIDSFVENANKQTTVNNACSSYLKASSDGDETGMEQARTTLKDQGYSDKQVDTMLSNAKTSNIVAQAKTLLSQGNDDEATKLMQEGGISEKEIDNIISDNNKQKVIQEASNKVLQGDIDGAKQTLKDSGFNALQIKVALSDATTQKNIQDAYNLAVVGGSENIEQARKTLKKNGLEDSEVETLLSNAKTQKIAQDLYKNITTVQQDDSSTCAVVSVLNAINNKPMLAQAVINKFEYDEENGTYKFNMFNDDFEVKLEDGENLLQKVYEAYEITYGKDISGDFVNKVFDEILDGGSDIITKPTSSNIETLKAYSDDENSILTFNTSSDIEGLSKGHSYTVLGIDDNGNIKLQDPTTLEEITITKEQYESSDCQIVGKTLADEDLVDSDSEAKMVRGTTTEGVEEVAIKKTTLKSRIDAFIRKAKLSKITYTNSDGINIIMFANSSCIDELVSNKDVYDRAIKLSKLTYTNKSGRKQNLFTSESALVKAARDSEIYDRVIELSKLTYTEFGENQEVFTSESALVKAASDSEIYDRAIELSKLTYTEFGENQKVFTDESALVKAASDSEIYDRAIELSKLTYTEFGENQKVFKDGNALVKAASDSEIYDRAIELSKLTYTDSYGRKQSLFKDGSSIAKLASDTEIYDRAIKLSKLTYTDSYGRKQSLFKDGSSIVELASDSEIYDRAIKLSKLTYTDLYGIEQRVFIDGYNLVKLASDSEIYDRAIELSKLTYTDSDGEKQKLFTYGGYIVKLASDSEIYDRAIKLSEITYTDSDGNEQRVFTNENVLVKTANDKTISIDDDFTARAIKLSEITYTDSDGNKQRVFINENTLVETVSNSELYDRIIELKGIIDEKDVQDVLIDYIKFNTPIEIFKINDINEIPREVKKEFLRKLLEYNKNLFNLSDTTKKYFPLVPSNQEEYCTLLPNLVKSLGIDTRELSDSDIIDFNKSIASLSTKLKELSDSDFENLTIQQEYSKEEFIKDVYEITKNLSDKERQKVFDYFGFELTKNPNSVTVDSEDGLSYSIFGYPININNGEKLAQISDDNTKKTVEILREKVIQFSEGNKIYCSDSEIEENLNKIFECIPELRTTIDRVQNEGYDYDVFQHSLRAMQKIVQNSEFDKLNDSDKKIILLACLMHDIAKTEGYQDEFHEANSAFDSFFIAKKFDLNSEEEVKLYSLIEVAWLDYCNNPNITTIEKEKRQKEMAFKLQSDNLFELSKILTQADLKAAQGDDSYIDKYKSAFDEISDTIGDLIVELKSTQPMLPVTKLPTSSKISEAIEYVNDDGSTNLKGIYKTKDGLVVIRYNEVENETWEKIGFPVGSISKGIKTTTLNDRNVDTGNIKFFIHGLDNNKKIAKFYAFNLPNSEDLLSVSYAELPESKFTFFRTKGVILDTDAKYVYGGGETDAGSGIGKNIKEFINNYAYKGAKRYSDRTFVSDLIKQTLNLSDEEYIEFYETNKNKAMSEIEPEEMRTKLVEAFASINSHTRKGERAYNEMYISNPRVMGVFAYPHEETREIGDTMEFVENQEDFLKSYAIKQDIPMIIFGY